MQKLLALLFAILFTTVSLQAQTEKNTEKIREMKEMRAKELQSKSDASNAASAEKQKAMQAQGIKPDALNRGGGMSANVASDLKLSTDEEKRNINGYKVDFASNPYGLADNAIATISLYSGVAQNQQKIGVINFYGKGAKMLAERKVVDDKKFITLNYDLEGFAAVQDFLATGNRLALVHNNKTKEAYISTDVMPTRTK